MKKIVLAAATAATLAVTTLAAPAPAEARGGRIAAGVGLGLLGGAIIGGAIANGGGYYGPGYGYYGGPAPGYYRRGRPPRPARVPGRRALLGRLLLARSPRSGLRLTQSPDDQPFFCRHGLEKSNAPDGIMPVRSAFL